MKALKLLLFILLFFIAGCFGENVDKKLTNKEVVIELYLQKKESFNAFKKLIEKFEIENPGISVKLTSVPNASKILLTRMSSHEAPDIFGVWPTQPDFKLEAKKGFIKELTNEPFVNQIRPWVVDLIKMDEKIYTLPLSTNAMGVFYNTKMFNDLNLKIPTTYKELIELCNTSLNNGITPIIFPYKDSTITGQVGQMLVGLKIKNMKPFFDQIRNGTLSSKDNSEFIQVADKILELLKYSGENYLRLSYDQAIDQFANSKGLMFIQGTSAIPSIKKANPNFEFEMFPFPADDKKDTKILVGIDNALSLSSKGVNMDSAKKFIEFMATTENAQLYSNMDKSMSAIISTISDVEHYGLLVNKIDVGKTYEWPNSDWTQGVSDNFGEIIQKLIATRDKDAFFMDIDRIFASMK